MVELEFEPQAAVERYRRLSEELSGSRRYQALGFLALAYAHVGDSDAAFEAALESAGSPSSGQRFGHALGIALGHASGRLDEVELVEPHASFEALLEALRGGEADRQALRLERPLRFVPVPGPTMVYLTAALAPGNEEAFIRGFSDPNVSLSVDLRRRANAARWRGDTEAEGHWKARRAEVHARAQKGDSSALHLVLSRR